MNFILILLVLGAGGLIGQILLLREFLVIASGNELAIGIFLGNWLVLEALGCWLAGKLWSDSRRPAEGFALCQAFYAAALPAALYAARCLRQLCGVPPGEGLSMAVLFFSSLLLLAAVSAPHGALFALANRMRQEERPGADAGGLVYGWETLGTLAGGLLLTFWLLPRFQPFRIALAVSSLSLLACAAALRRGQDRGAPALQALCAAAALAAAILAWGSAAGALQRDSVQRQWPGSQVAFYGDSVYGNVTVLKSGEQHTFLKDGALAATAPVPDTESVEELAHFALLSHPNPEDVLVLGGGAGGLLREILKHPVRHVDYAELDPLLLAALARFAAPLTAEEFHDPRVRIHAVDGRLLVRSTPRRYDVLLVGAPRPSNLQANRLFTREFFVLARSRLKPGGLLVFSLPGSTAFLEKNLARLNSCVMHTAAQVFAQVRPIPGDTNIFLAGDSPAVAALDAGVLIRRLQQRQIRSAFVGPQDLSLRLEAQWPRMLRDFLAPFEAQAGTNTDFDPRAVLHDLANWNAMFSPAAARLFAWAGLVSVPRLALALSIALGIVLSWHFRGAPLDRWAAPAAVAATGFAGMVYNMALTFAFQALYGFVYLWIGLLVSIFMFGAALGSLLVTRSKARARPAFLRLEAVLAGFSLALPAAFIHLAQAPVPDAWLKAAFLALCLISGALTGAQFPLACRIAGCGAAALYSCDLLGGWLGGILGGALLLPVLGLAGACLCVAVAKLASLAFCAAALPAREQAR